jgi:hypothetical protein
VSRGAWAGALLLVACKTPPSGKSEQALRPRGWTAPCIAEAKKLVTPMKWEAMLESGPEDSSDGSSRLTFSMGQTRLMVECMPRSAEQDETAWRNEKDPSLGGERRRRTVGTRTCAIGSRDPAAPERQVVERAVMPVLDRCLDDGRSNP